MRFLPLICGSLLRKPVRTVLIFLQVSVAFALFGILQGMKTGVDEAIAKARADLLQVIPQGGVSIPIAYLDRLRAIPGVKTVTFQDGFASSAVPLQVKHWLTLVPVEIGSATVLLGLDLGADDQMGLTKRGIELLQAKRLGGAGTQLDVQGNVLHENRLIVPKFRIGDTTFTNVTAATQESVPYHLRGVYGHIGRGLLVNYRVELDLPHARMWLWHGGNRTPDDQCQGKVVPVLSEKHGILTNVATDYGALTMLWDDGAPFNVIHPEILQPGAGSSEHVTTRRFILNGTNFGPQELYPMKFSQPPGIAGFIGYDFLAKHDVCFDLPGRRVIIRK